MTSVYSQLKSFCLLGLQGTTIKWVMVTANLAQMLLGPIFIGMGLMLGFLEDVINNIPVVNWFVEVDWFSAPLYATGVLILCITSIGALAAYKELKTLVLLYSIIMTLLVVGQIVMVCYGLYQVKHRSQIWIEWAFTKPSLRKLFHAVEATMHCCGARGSSDYKDNNEAIPFSCCEDPVDNEGGKYCPGKLYKPCVEVLPRYIQMLKNKIGSWIYYVIGVQALDAIVSSALFKAMTPS